METIISVTVIALGITASLAILRTSLSTNSVIGEKIVALNLAIEGIEALKNIRDTNYLRFASDPDSCWVNLSATDVADCSPATSIDDGTTYYFTRDLTDDYFEWGLAPTSSSARGALTIYNLDIDGDGTEDSEIYAQSGLSGGIILDSEDTTFRRTVICMFDGSSTMDATIIVSWISNGVSHEVSLTRTIANVY